MKGHVALTTKGNAIGDLIPEGGMVSVGLDMVGGKSALVLLALPTALLTDVAIALQDRLAPDKVLRILESLPRAATFPVVVAIAAWNCTLTKFGLKLLSFGRVGHTSSPCFRSNLRSRFLGGSTIERAFTLNSGMVFWTLLQPELPGPALDGCARDTKSFAEDGVMCRGVQIAELLLSCL
jgi:hypothetical protein